MKSIAAALLFFVLLITCNAQDLNGKWKGLLSTPNGDMELVFTFKVDSVTLTGNVVSDYAELPLEKGKISGNEFSFEVNADGRIFSNSGVLDGDIFKLSAPGLPPMELTRIKDASKIDGVWTGKVEGPQGETELTFTFKVEGDSLTGKNSSTMGDFNLLNGKVNGNDFSFDVDLGGMTISHKCSLLEDDSIDVKANVMDQEVAMKLNRKK